MNRFIRELRRREVFRTAGLYVGVCWILIEAASVLLPTFDAPDWALRAVVIVAIVGFPVMLVLAWVYDLTDHGIEVQADPTDTMIAPLGSRKMDFVVIGVLSVALILSIYMNVTSGPAVVEDPDPVTVLIADFDNQTGNPLFDGLLEQALNIGVEGAPNIASYLRNEALQVAAIVQPGATALGPDLARLVAVREGIGFVLAGKIVADGSGFEIDVRAIDPATGEEVFTASEGAKAADGVLSALGTLSEDVREELGDNTLDQPDATSSPFTAASLEAAKAFTTAIQLEFDGKPDEAVAQYKIATELDPNFGRAYAGWALNEFKLGNNEAAEALLQKALSMMETMTERERLRTLGIYYSIVTRNYENAVQTFTELVEKYPADAAGHSNLAVASFLTLDFGKATEEGGRILEIYPGSRLYLSNYALYAMYSGDFDAAAAASQKLIDESPEYGISYLPLAVARITAGDFAAARAAYQAMARAETSDHRASSAALGLGDLEAYLGNFTEARAILEAGFESDVAAQNTSAAAVKSIALAEVNFAAGDTQATKSAAERALTMSSQESVAVAAARVLLALGDKEKAAEISGQLTAKLQPQSRAYGLMIQALIAREAGGNVQAIDLLRSAVNLADLWLLRYELGRTYLEAGFFAEAVSEFNACEERRGEGSALFLDDRPTVRYLAELPYWIGRAQQGVGMQTSANQNFERFLALRPEGGPLADDASQRTQ
jgi:tetratricopeptide (TPR) repeat protein